MEAIISSEENAIPLLMELQNLYEAEYGKKPTPKEQRLMDATYQIGIKLAEMGRRHKKEGHEPISKSEIQKLAAGIAHTEFRNIITQLMYEDYIYGYNDENRRHRN